MSLTRDSLLFSPTRDGIPSSDDCFSAEDILSAQAALEAEAREAIPYSFSQGCSYDQGYVKQPGASPVHFDGRIASLFACKTCLNYAGVCASCSIACHGEHELVELFLRRDFRCDCGTERMGAGSKCSLSGRDDEKPNYLNRYDRSFQGSFCICGKDYDPLTETDSMYQCLVCEDWLHHACLFGSHVDENKSPLDTDEFDLLICHRCVQKNSRVRHLLDRWAGAEGRGVMMVSKDDVVLGRVITDENEEGGGVDEEGAVEAGGEVAAGRKVEAGGTGGDEPTSAVGEKRKATSTPSSPSAVEAPAPKKPKLPLVETASISSVSSSAPSSDSPTIASATTASSSVDPHGCTAPPVLPEGTSILAKLETEGARLNVYLEEGWMERWCRCEKCINLFISFPFLLEEEETLEPPEDPDAHKSSLDLGMEALERLPRGQANDGLAAFRGLGDRLKEFLQPLAEGGKTVTKADVDTFFAAETERRRSGV